MGLGKRLRCIGFRIGARKVHFPIRKLLWSISWRLLGKNALGRLLRIVASKPWEIRKNNIKGMFQTLKGKSNKNSQNYPSKPLPIQASPPPEDNSLPFNPKNFRNTSSHPSLNAQQDPTSAESTPNWTTIPL